MQKLMVLLCFVFLSHLANGQKIEDAIDIHYFVEQIENLKPVKIYEGDVPRFDSLGKESGTVHYTYVQDTLQKKLVKVIVQDPQAQSVQTYYFYNEQLIKVKEVKDINKQGNFHVSLFTNSDYSIATNFMDYYKNSGVENRQRFLADAYKLLISFHKLSGG